MASDSKRVTLAQIAESAGVSVATVSKVINGRPDVGQQKREEIQDALRRHNYGGFRDDLRVYPTVELFLGMGQFSVYTAEVLRGVIDAAALEGVAVVASRRTEHDPNVDPTSWARDLTAVGRRAVVASTADPLARPIVDALRRARLPLVLIDPESRPDASVASVGSTNFTGGYEATEHLLGLGHRRIAYLGGRQNLACVQARLHGFRSAMDAAGNPVSDELIRFGTSFDMAEGIKHGGDLLDTEPAPTAVFAASDTLAVGVIEAARRRGVRVPDDLSVVGFDDTLLAHQMVPPLTTVRQPIPEMGALALRTALRLAAGEEIDSHHVELATRLIVRESTQPPQD
ncbi:LacI family DNA-binding transcriptional regulator [Streptomyces sp. NPDC090088]|uniref:LacI family DNA-binding transcriptional regulator n=1 Tax=Streptomyces sp. NPDC090088 TaxID=3365944 RepID=UPI0037FE9050